MKNIKYFLLLGALLLSNNYIFAADKKQSAADHLQAISVTIRAESSESSGEGSGVIFTRKDSNNNTINLVWTAAHVVDNLRSERQVLVNGVRKTIIEFKDPVIIKEIRQDGRIVGSLQMDAEVLKYSDSENGHDLALLKIRKFNFISDSVSFYLEKDILPLGTDLLHVGSLLGQMGANSMTDGIYSQHGRIIKDLNSFVFDQTTCIAFRGSSGGGIFLKNDDRVRYVGMLVRGAGQGFNLIVPIRRMVQFCEKNDIMWALDSSLKMPDEKDLKKSPIEGSLDETKNEKNKDEKNVIRKNFPFMLYIKQKNEIYDRELQP